MRICRSVGQPRIPGRQWHAALLLGGALFVVAGCGTAAYEERLENTKEMYTHLEVLDDHLGREWSDGAIQLRPPTQFVLIPPPEAPPEGEKHNVLDPRQPDYMNFEIPGLAAAFRAEVKVDEEGEPSTRPAYLYIAGTQHLPPKEDPAEFGINLVKDLSRAANIHPAPPPDEWKFDDHFPVATVKFVDQVNYTVVSFDKNPKLKGTKTEFRAFVHRDGETQVVLLFVLPEALSSSEGMGERISYCLETLRVSGAKPAAAGGAPGPAAGGF